MMKLFLKGRGQPWSAKGRVLWTTSASLGRGARLHTGGLDATLAISNFAFSVPGTCSHNYGEVRGKISLPGANVVSGPKCCNGGCLQTPVVKNEL